MKMCTIDVLSIQSCLFYCFSIHSHSNTILPLWYLCW